MCLYFVLIRNEKQKRGRIEDLYITHASAMYKVAYRILNDEYLAQDAVHEAFINISNNFDKIINTDSLALHKNFSIFQIA